MNRDNAWLEIMGDWLWPLPFRLLASFPSPAITFLVGQKDTREESDEATKEKKSKRMRKNGRNETGS